MFSFKKIAAGALVIGVARATPVDKTLTDGQEKRYSQLIGMMEYNNANFDDRQYWTYGCNCLMLGDRPMSEPGKGQPVDALDTVCKRYKDCLKCASMTHGDQCLGEIVRYRVNMNAAPVCKDDVGTCGRDLCECDKLFAEEHVGAIGSYSDDYHRFYTTTGFDANTDCVKGSGGTVIPECCGVDGGPKYIFNAHTKVCCADGTIKTDVTQC